MKQLQTVNVRAFIDERPLSRQQLYIVVLVVLVVALDGMDVGIMGFAAPEIIRTWGISKAEMGTVLSSVFVGMAAGAALAGPMGDRFGRKLLIIASVLWFGLMTLLTALTTGLASLVVMRILTGIGLGAALPSALALMAEYAPRQTRSLILTIAFSGFTAGSTAAGFLAASMIPSLGWKATSAAAGLLPVFFAGTLVRWLPESIAFLSLRHRTARIPEILRAIDPHTSFAKGATFWLPVAAKEPEGSFAVLLSKQYIVTLSMLCIAYFMGVLVTYIIVGWLPVIAKEAGFALTESAFIASIFTLAGPLGSISVGFAMDRLGAHRLLVATFTVSAILLACTALVPKRFEELGVFMLTLGFFIHGTIAGLQALSPQSFPTSARSTGVGCMHTVGRVGAIGSGILGDVLLNLGWKLEQIFLGLASAMLIGGLAMALTGIWGTTRNGA